MDKQELEKGAIKVLIALQKSSDHEDAHIKADDVLCDLLSELGFSQVVSEFMEIEKWYA